MATGQTLLEWDPRSNEPPASAFSTLDLRNNQPVLDHAAGSDESCVFSAVMPQQYDGNGVEVYVHWTANATTGNCKWDGAFERQGEVQDVDSDSFATAQTVTDTTQSTNGIIKISQIDFTDGAQMDSIAAGEKFRFKLTRDANAAGDTLAQDAEVHKIEIREA
jgi:hypothetical protein